MSTDPRIAYLYGSGLSLEAVGKEVGLTKEAVQRRLKDMGITIRKGGRIPQHSTQGDALSCSDRATRRAAEEGSRDLLRRILRLGSRTGLPNMSTSLCAQRLAEMSE